MNPSGKAARRSKDREANPPIVRQCALTNEHLTTDELIRFVLSPDQVVTPDLRRKLPGRGLWLTADETSIAQAVKKKLFARGFRQQAVVPDNLVDMIKKLLRKDALLALSLANKAGLVISGYEKIKSALGKGDVEQLLHAAEASSGGSDKLDRLFSATHAKQAGSDDPNLVSGVLPRLFTGAELSLALGRSNVIHIGLKQGDMARRFHFALQKAAAFELAEQAEVPKAGGQKDKGMSSV